MDHIETCPDRETLGKAALGHLAEDGFLAVEAHLEQCAACLQAMRSLAADDDLLDALRQHAGFAVTPKADADSIQQLIRKLTSQGPTQFANQWNRQRHEAYLATASVGGDSTLAPALDAVETRPADRAIAFDFLAPPQSADELGRLGPYRVLKVLGQGGMGVVFQADDPRLGRLCALKAMRPEVAERPGMKERFLREARAAAAIDSDYVIPIYQVDEANGVPYIAMPFLKGMSLEDWLRARQGDESGANVVIADALRLAREIASGLAAAHAQGMIHRDIKPANIWLDDAAAGRATILDFGLARFSAGTDQQDLTHSGMILGTPSYMSPEQAQGLPVDARADLFSLGVVLYRLCTGELPFRGTDALSALSSLATHNPPAPGEVNPSIPRDLSDLVMRLLAKDREARVSTADEVLAAIGQIESELPNADRGKAGRSKGAFRPGQSGRRSLPRGQRLIAWGAAGLAALLAGIVLYWQTDKGTVRIEINAPDISARFDHDETTITQTDKPAVRLSSGPRGLRIQYGDLEFETDKFVLARGETVDLKVELLPGNVRLSQDGRTIEQWALPTAHPEAQGVARSVDLLAMVYLSRDVVAGEWKKRDDGALVSPGTPPFSRIEIPYIPPEEYILEVVAQRASSDPTALALGLVAGGRRFRVAFDKLVGEELESNVAIANTSKVLAHRGQVLYDSRPTRIRCTVRPGQVRIEADEQRLIDWTGDLDDLVYGDRWTTPHANRLMLGNTGELLIHEVKLLAVSGEGITPRSPADETAPPVATGWRGWPADAPPPAYGKTDADQMRLRQEAWAQYLGLPVEYTNGIGMRFRLIPPGEYLMGSNPGEIEETLAAVGDDESWRKYIRSEGPRHRAVLTQPVYMGVHEVTQAQYERIMGQNPSHFAATGEGKDAVAGLDTANHPVERVSWLNAAAFCNKLSDGDQLSRCYFDNGRAVSFLAGEGYRLPTEAEWEFACRAGTASKYWSGSQNETLVHAGWFGLNSGSRTHAVGELRANPLGLHDTHGNVWEWVQDEWEPNYYAQFEEQDAINPTGPSSGQQEQVIRGGCFGMFPWTCRSSHRWSLQPNCEDSSLVGFRIVLSVAAVKRAIEQAGVRPSHDATDGSALEFDGQDDFVEIPSLSRDEARPITIEAWVRDMTDFIGVIVLVNGKAPAQLWSDRRVLMGSELDIDAKLHRSVSVNAPFSSVHFPWPSPDDQWTHVAYVVDNQESRIYVNGRMDRGPRPTTTEAWWREPGEFAQPSVEPRVTGTVIGKVQNFPDELGWGWMRGQLDEVRISSTARYDQDFQPSRHFEPDDETLALYHFDDGEGDTLTDSSGHGHHGKITGATWVAVD